MVANSTRGAKCSKRRVVEGLARDAAGDKNTAIIRLERLYPFPGEPLTIRLKRMVNLEEVVWAQEEPRNNGSWFFVEPFIEGACDLRIQKLGEHFRAFRRVGVSGEWKTNTGTAVMEEVACEEASCCC